MFMEGISWSTFESRVPGLLSVSCLCLSSLLYLVVTGGAAAAVAGASWHLLSLFLSLWTTEGRVYYKLGAIRSCAAVCFASLFLTMVPAGMASPHEYLTTALGMPSDGNDLLLLHGVFSGNFGKVKAALQAGANVNGSPEQSVPPVTAAVIANRAGFVNVLLERGADPDRPVTVVVPCPSSGRGTSSPGERALHIAARRGSVETVRLLLKRSRADPNVTDNTGRTPLMATCISQQACAEVVRLLLEAGADPALTSEGGFIPLHMVAANGDMDLVDLLYTAAPATLNFWTDGQTPLYLACFGGQESIVSKLLSLGAMERMPPDGRAICPLAVAVENGFVGVVRVLLNEGGIRAIGDPVALPRALHLSLCAREAIILRLLLAVNGEERRSAWANTNFEGRHLLHYGARFCDPAGVSILLEAGADETARDSEGRIPLDAIGRRLCLGRNGDKPQIDQGGRVAIARMLQRGPAYRARSWAWPSDAQDVDAGTSGDGGTAAAVVDADAVVLSSPPAVPKAPVIGVRIFRAKEKSSSNFFVRLVDRYCAKD